MIKVKLTIEELNLIDHALEIIAWEYSDKRKHKARKLIEKLEKQAETQL
jgi:hypothetical protein